MYCCMRFLESRVTGARFVVVVMNHEKKESITIYYSVSCYLSITHIVPVFDMDSVVRIVRIVDAA